MISERRKQTKFALVTAYRECPGCSIERRDQGEIHNLPVLSRWDKESRKAKVPEFSGPSTEDQELHTKTALEICRGSPSGLSLHAYGETT